MQGLAAAGRTTLQQTLRAGTIRLGTVHIGRTPTESTQIAECQENHGLGRCPAHIGLFLGWCLCLLPAAAMPVIISHSE